MGFSKHDIKGFLNPLECQIGALCRKLTDSSNTNSEILEVLQDIQTLLSSQQESVDPILYCDEDCNITGGVGFLVDPDTLLPTPIYFDADLNTSTTPPEGAPCDPACQQDFEFKTIGPQCFQDADGLTYNQYICNTYINGVLDTTTTIWVLPDGSTTDTQPDGLEPCVDPIIQIINVPQCYEDCTTGYSLVKVNCTTNEVTPLGNYTLVHQPTTLGIVECQPIQTVETTSCVSK